MTIAVVIPFASTDEDRLANLEHVRGYYRRLFPDAPIIAADDGGCRAGWTKAHAITRGMAQTDATTIVVADSDCLCDAVVDAAQAVEDGAARWAFPHTQIRRLDRPSSNNVRAGATPHLGMGLEFKAYAGVAGGGICVIARDTWAEAPMDPRFKVTHGEDVAWARGLAYLCGRPWYPRSASPLYHLHHPPILAVGLRYRHNQRLAAEYDNATSLTIRDVIARGQAHVDPPAVEPLPAAGDIAVIVPVIRRPASAAPFMASFRDTNNGHSAVYAVADPDDAPTIAAWRREGATVLLGDRGSTFAAKVNYGLEATSEPWLLLVGDDVRFHHFWAEAALEAGQRGAVVSTNDLARTDLDQLAVHPLIARRYAIERGASFDGPGLLAHEGYRHWYVDREWSFLAAERGELVYAPDARIEHLHHLFGKGQRDAINELGQAAAHDDAQLYRLRESQYTKRIRRSPDA